MKAQLSGKAVLVTGASRGIGAAIAKLCHQAGARVLLHASGPSDMATSAADAAGRNADDLLYEDLSRPGAGARLVARATEKAGRVDAVVNNAGVYLASPLSGGEQEWRDGWATTMAVNVQAPADICRAAISHFRKADGGIVVNIASRAGHRGDGPDHAAYAASKGAVLAMTKTYARALSGENILFYAIAPGWVETRMAPQDIEARKNAVHDIPLGRVAAPEEIAAMTVFLLTGVCASATGATFDINGASYVR
ncbi:MAG: SDR family oxidoreductase [Pseudomonadota bacterium]